MRPPTRSTWPASVLRAAGVSPARDWRGDTSASRFLHEVRDGACDLFATTLSPDYNAAHRDHLHLDQAERGTMGWRGCR